MKKKLRLQIEKLRVEQFEVQPDSPGTRGTVHGLGAGSPDTACIGPSEPWRYCAPMPDSYSCMLNEC